jgi:hypothetical protein
MMLPAKEVCGDEGLVDECLHSSLYLTMLVIIYLAFQMSLRGICRMVGPGGEARPIRGFFTCS